MPGSTGSTPVVPRAHQFIWLAVLALACAIAAGEIALFFRYTVDDALISLRFARNLASGLGLVYNPGDRVEGFSNPLWVLLASAALRAGLPAVLFSKLLGLAAYMATLALLLFHARALAPDARSFRILAAAVMTVVAASFGMTYYATSGLETVSVGALLLAVILAAATRPLSPWPWLLLIPLMFSRPEAPAYALVPAAALWLARREARRTVSWRSFAAPAFAVGVLAAGFAARWSYYRSLVPNTFFSKMPWTHGGEESNLWPLRGFDDIADFARAVELPLLAVLLALAVMRAAPSRVVRLSVIALTIGLAVQKWVGGDWMFGARFMVPLIPVAGLLWLEALAPWTRRMIDTRALTAAGAAVVLLVLLSHCNDALTFMHLTDSRHVQMTGDMLTSPGEWVHEHVPPEWTMVSGAIGAVGYYGGCRMVDRQGLVSRDIAHLYAAHLDFAAASTSVRDYIAALEPEVYMNETIHSGPATLRFGPRTYVKEYERMTPTYGVELYVREDRVRGLRNMQPVAAP